MRKDIGTDAAKEFFVSDAVSGMIQWLRSNHFQYKKPQGVPPVKADIQKQEECISQYNRPLA